MTSEQCRLELQEITPRIKAIAEHICNMKITLTPDQISDSILSFCYELDKSFRYPFDV